MAVLLTIMPYSVSSSFWKYVSPLLLVVVVARVGTLKYEQDNIEYAPPVITTPLDCKREVHNEELKSRGPKRIAVQTFTKI